MASDSANDLSVVLMAQCGDFEALLTGDAETSVLDAMARDESLTDVDVVKVGHHGSKKAVDARTLQALRPEIAVVSVGEGNRFGHPAQSTLDLLSACGARTVRTDEAGDVTFTVKGASTTLETTR